MSEKETAPLVGVVHPAESALDELTLLIHAAHMETCTDFDCPCNVQMARDAAEELFLRLKIQNGDA